MSRQTNVEEPTRLLKLEKSVDHLSKLESKVDQLASLMTSFITESQRSQYHARVSNVEPPQVVVEPKGSSRKRSLTFSDDGDGKSLFIIHYTL